MAKPLGISIGINSGLPTLRVNESSKAMDAIWDAVEEAINSGMTPEQFKMEAAEAWAERLKEDSKSAVKTLTK